MAETITVERESAALFVARQGPTVVGRARIAIGDGVWEAFSTNVDPAVQGHGVGALLARALLEAADAAGVTVIPSCWFIDGYLDRHPGEFGHLRAGQRAEELGDDPLCRIAPSVVTPASTPGA